MLFCKLIYIPYLKNWRIHEKNKQPNFHLINLDPSGWMWISRSLCASLHLTAVVGRLWPHPDGCSRATVGLSKGESDVKDIQGRRVKWWNGCRWITEGGDAVWSPVRAWWIRYPTWCAWDGEDQKTWLKNACIHGMLMGFVRWCDWFGTQRLTIQIFLFQQFHISFSGITITWGGWAGEQTQDCLFPY